VNNPKQFGVVVVGDEILTGKRTDRHLSHVIKLLHSRGMQVAWSRVVGDDRKRLANELKLTQQDDIPVFCFGGIGATPDDRTRQAAAEAFGGRQTRNPDAVAMIEDQFGAEAYPNRVLMADLPEGCLLIPNAYNRVPGFTLYDHHFFPGFPLMAWPMLEWVLNRYYPARYQRQQEKSLRVINARESELIQTMNELSMIHPGARLFSLAHMSDVDSIEIGFRGAAGPVDAALSDLVSRLSKRAFRFEMPDSDLKSTALKRSAV